MKLRKSTEWKDNLHNEREKAAHHIADEGLISKMYKELIQLKNKQKI